MQSSANSNVKRFVAFSRSLIKKRKSKGPKQLPCGIPEKHGSLLEFTLDSPDIEDK